METARSLARNVAILLTSQIVTALLSSALLLTLPVYLGVVGLGRFAFAQSICQAVSAIAVMGTDTYLVRQIASDRRHLAQLVWTGTFLRVGLWLLASAAAAGLLLLRGSPPQAIEVFLAFSLVTLATMANSILAAALAGLELMGRRSSAAVAGAAVSLATGLPVVMLTHSAIWLCSALGLGMLVNLTINMRHFRQARLPFLLPGRGDFGRLLVGAAPFIGLALAQGVYSQAATIVLGLVAGDVAVGRYSSADRFSPVVILVAVVLISALLPAMTRLHTSHSSEAALAFRKIFDVTILLVVPAGVGISIVAPLVYRAFYPPAFAPATVILQVMGPSWALTAIAMVLGAAIFALGGQRQFFLATAIILGVLLVLGAVLIAAAQHLFANGGLGAACATALSEALMVLAALRLLPKGLLNRSTAIQSVRVLAAVIVMSITALSLAWTPMAIEVAAAAGAYFLAAFALGAVRADELKLAIRLLRSPRKGSVGAEPATPAVA